MLNASLMEQASERVPFLRALPVPDRERLRAHAELRRLSRGDSFWRQGDAPRSFAFVVRGRLKLVKASERGREVILQLCGPGELLCASAVCACAPYCCGSAALEDDAEVLVLPRRDVLALLERCPPAARAFLEEITARGVNLCQRVEELTAGLVQRRVSLLLLRLADTLGQPRGKEGTWIPIPLSRHDIADLCGTTIETAIRVMTRLAREGLVKTVARGFIVKDREGLERVARSA